MTGSKRLTSSLLCLFKLGQLFLILLISSSYPLIASIAVYVRSLTSLTSYFFLLLNFSPNRILSFNFNKTPRRLPYQEAAYVIITLDCIRTSVYWFIYFFLFLPIRQYTYNHLYSQLLERDGFCLVVISSVLRLVRGEQVSHKRLSSMSRN